MALDSRVAEANRLLAQATTLRTAADEAGRLGFGNLMADRYTADATKREEEAGRLLWAMETDPRRGEKMKPAGFFQARHLHAICGLDLFARFGDDALAAAARWEVRILELLADQERKAEELSAKSEKSVDGKAGVRMPFQVLIQPGDRWTEADGVELEAVDVRDLEVWRAAFKWAQEEKGKNLQAFLAPRVRWWRRWPGRIVGGVAALAASMAAGAWLLEPACQRIVGWFLAARVAAEDLVRGF